MTDDAKKFRESVGNFEVFMVNMTHEERFRILAELAGEHHQLTRRTYPITELLSILRYMEDNYLHMAMCRAIITQLFLPLNYGDRHDS